MSHDVLDELRRRLVGAPDSPDSPPDERRPDGSERAGSATRAPLATDGGDSRDADDDEHLRDLPDGAGCTEIWEHLSERQSEEGGSSEPGAVECRADD